MHSLCFLGQYYGKITFLALIRGFCRAKHYTVKNLLTLYKDVLQKQLMNMRLPYAKTPKRVP